MNLIVNFTLSQRVIIVEIDQICIVRAIRYDGLGVQYLLTYFCDGKAQEVWACEDELVAA